MNQAIRDAASGILEKMQYLDDNYLVRDTGMTQFKSAKTELQAIIDLPDSTPDTVVRDVVADETMNSLITAVTGMTTNLTQRMQQVETAVTGLVQKSAPAPAPAA
jgi:hypothetical protein